MSLFNLSVLVTVGATGLIFLYFGLRRYPHLFLLLFIGANAADYKFFTHRIGIPGVTDRIYISDVLMAGAVLTWIILRKQSKVRLPRAPLRFPIVLFMVVGFVCIFRGLFVDPAAAFGNGRFVMYPLTYFLAYDASYTNRRPDWLIWFFTSLVTVVSFAGVVTFAVLLPESLKVIGFPGKFSIYGLYAFVFWASGVVVLTTRTRRLSLFVNAVMIAVSGVRQTLFLVPLILVILRDRMRRGFAVVLLLISLVFIVGVLLRAGSGTEAVYGDTSAAAYGTTLANPMSEGTLIWRLEYWRALTEEVIAPNLLVGLGVWSVFTDLRLSGFRGETSHSPHNCFLVLLVFGGIPLLGAYLLIIWAAFRRYMSAVWKGIPRLGNLASVAVFILLSTQVALGLNAEHRIAGVWPMMWALLGAFDAVLLRGLQEERRARAKASTSSATEHHRRDGLSEDLEVEPE